MFSGFCQFQYCKITQLNAASATFCATGSPQGEGSPVLQMVCRAI